MQGQNYPVSGNYTRTLLIAFLLMFFCLPGQASTVDDGIAATKRGDYVSALQIFRTLAERGDTRAQNNLGAMYQNGLGMAVDNAQAMSWYRKAADQGYAGAQYNICVMYQEGFGVVRDYAQAVTWCRKAADSGYANAQNNLGVMYQNGYGILQDHVQAIALYRKAAAQGLVAAQYNLGYMYLNGYGVAKDYVQAATLYRKSADMGYTEAQGNLGYMYLNGFGVRQDALEGLKWTLLALTSPTLDPNSRSIFDKNRAILTLKLTDAQIIAAQQWVSQWKPAATDTAIAVAAASRKKDSVNPVIHSAGTTGTGNDIPSVSGREDNNGIIANETVPVEAAANMAGDMVSSQGIALIIGIDRYSSILQAESAEDDARAFYDHAINDLGIPPNRIKMLIGTEAKLQDIRETLRTWPQQFIEQGRTEVYVYFSGHGLASENGNGLFLLPYDIERSLLTSNSIRRREIIDAMIDAGAASTTMFLDTCHSVRIRKDVVFADILNLSQISCIPSSVIRIVRK